MPTIYRVENDTDGIGASPEDFNSRKEAEDFCKEFRSRFAAQGYYLDCRHRYIDPEDVELRIEEVWEPGEPRKLHPTGPAATTAFKIGEEGEDADDQPFTLESMLEANSPDEALADLEMIAWLKQAAPGEVYMAPIGGGATKIRCVLAE